VENSLLLEAHSSSANLETSCFFFFWTHCCLHRGTYYHHTWIFILLVFRCHVNSILLPRI